MRAVATNPPANLIPISTTDKVVVDAIEASGYPLQGVVTEKLLAFGFGAAEEWGYIDRDTGENRALDIHAWIDLPPDEVHKIFSSLALLIECKRSVHPFVFFKKVTKWQGTGFPAVVNPSRVSLYTDNMSRDVPLSDVLCAGELAFVREPPLCSVFSRATLSGGNKAELSGDETYKNIVLPLVKAVDYYRELWSGGSSGGPLHPKVHLAVCVVNAAMVLVESPHKLNDPVLIPWVRVERHEAKPRASSQHSASHQHYAIDVVHVDYFDAFIRDRLVPFAHEFAQRASERAEVIRKGGVVDNLDALTWNQPMRPKVR